MSLVVLGAVLSPAIQRISNGHLADFHQNLFDELVVDALFDKEPTGGNAIFALVEEDAAHAQADGFIDVAVGEDDEGRLAAQFQGRLLQVRVGTGAHNDFSRLCAAGKAQLSHHWMFSKGLPDDASCKTRKLFCLTAHVKDQLEYLCR